MNSLNFFKKKKIEKEQKLNQPISLKNKISGTSMPSKKKHKEDKDQKTEVVLPRRLNGSVGNAFSFFSFFFFFLNFKIKIFKIKIKSKVVGKKGSSSESSGSSSSSSSSESDSESSKFFF